MKSRVEYGTTMLPRVKVILFKFVKNDLDY